MMRAALALVLCAAVANGQRANSRCTGGQKGPVCCTRTCDGYGKSCTIGLRAGLLQKVTCSLTDPIICPSDAEGPCEVALTVSNSHPQWVAVNPCLLRWTTDDWHQVKNLEIKTRDDYVEVNEDRQVHLATKVQSASPLYDNPGGDKSADFFLESKQRKSAHCSAVGDPHINTFDGRYWHYYDGDRRDPTRYTLFRSTKSDFVVQAQVYRNPAVHCGVAGRDGRNYVQINNCPPFGFDFQEDCPDDRELGLKENCPVVKVSGNTYTVTFKSGAWFRAQINGWGMNLYAETVDPSATCGVCGNFDGSSGNDAPGTRVSNYGSLYPCQKVCTKKIEPGCTCCQGTNCPENQVSCDVWEYKPEKKTTEGGGADAIPDAVAQCEYKPAYVDPIIGVQDVEDITDFLKQHTEDLQREDLILIDDEAGITDAKDAHKPNTALLAKSKAACQKRADDSKMIPTCRTIEAIDEEDVERKRTRLTEWSFDPAGDKSYPRIGLCKDLDADVGGGAAAARDCCDKATKQACIDDAKAALAVAEVTKKNLNNCAKCQQCDTDRAGELCTDCTKCFKRMEEEAIVDCEQDVEFEGGPETRFGRDQVHASISLLEEDCIAMMIAAGFRENHVLKDALCPQECNKFPTEADFPVAEFGALAAHGTCNNAKCNCVAPWNGVDCGIDETKAPDVTGVRQRYCNTESHDDLPPACNPDKPEACFDEPGCPKHLTVQGRGFLKATSKGGAPECKWSWTDDKGVKKELSGPNYQGKYTGSTVVDCPVPRGEGPGLHKGANPLKVYLQVRNQGGPWSAIEGEDQYTKEKTSWYMEFFNGDCLRCNEAAWSETAECAQNPNTCHIGEGADKQCFRPGDPDPEEYEFPGLGKVKNPCRHCDPYTPEGKTSFSYFFRDAACRPEFEKSEYEYDIVGKMDAGPLVKNDDNTGWKSPSGNHNVFVKEAPGYVAGLRYEIVSTSTGGTGASSADWFTIDESVAECAGKGEGCVAGTIRLKKSADAAVLCSNSEYCLSNPNVFNGIFKIKVMDKDDNEGAKQARVQVNLLNEENAKRPFTVGGKALEGTPPGVEVTNFEIAVFETTKTTGRAGDQTACMDWDLPADKKATCTEGSVPGKPTEPMILRADFKGLDARTLKVDVKDTIALASRKSLAVDVSAMVAGTGEATFTIADGASFDYEAIDKCRTGGVPCKCHQFNGKKVDCEAQKESKFALAGDDKPCVYHDATDACRAAPVVVQVQAATCKGEECTPAGKQVQLSITVLNVDEPPTGVYLISKNVAGCPRPEGCTDNDPSIKENQGNATVGTLKCYDPEDPDSCTFSIVAGDDAAYFEIDDAGVLRVTTAVEPAPDFEDLKKKQGVADGNNPTLKVKVKAADADGKSLEHTFTIDVLDVNEPPVAIQVVARADGSQAEGVKIDQLGADKATITLSEATPLGSVIAELKATDPDSENEGPPICSIDAEKEGEALFRVFQAVQDDADVNRVNLVIKSAENGGEGLDFESKKEWKFGIRCVDQPKSGKTLTSVEEFEVTVVVTNAEEAPSALVFTAVDPKLLETDTGSVGTLSATDADEGAADFAFSVDDAAWAVGAATCKATAAGGKECTANLELKAKPTSNCEAPNGIDEIKCKVYINLGGSEPEVAEVVLKNAPDKPTAVLIETGLNLQQGLKKGQGFGLITVEDPDGSVGEIGAAGHFLKLVSEPIGLGVRLKGGRRSRRSDFTAAAGLDFEFVVLDESVTALAVGADVKLFFTAKDPSFPGDEITLDAKPNAVLQVTKPDPSATTRAPTITHPVLTGTAEMTIKFKAPVAEAAKIVGFDMNGATAITAATIVRLYEQGAKAGCPGAVAKEDVDVSAKSALCTAPSASTDKVLKATFDAATKKVTVSPVAAPGTVNFPSSYEISQAVAGAVYTGAFYIKVDYTAAAGEASTQYLHFPVSFQGYCEGPGNGACSSISTCVPCEIRDVGLFTDIEVKGGATTAEFAEIFGAAKGADECVADEAKRGGKCLKKEGVTDWEFKNDIRLQCISRETGAGKDLDLARVQCKSEYDAVIAALEAEKTKQGCPKPSDTALICDKLTERIATFTYERDVSDAASKCKVDPERNAAECKRREELDKKRIEELTKLIKTGGDQDKATADEEDARKSFAADTGDDARKEAYVDAKKAAASASVDGQDDTHVRLQQAKLDELERLKKSSEAVKAVKAADQANIDNAVQKSKTGFKAIGGCSGTLPQADPALTAVATAVAVSKKNKGSPESQQNLLAAANKDMATKRGCPQFATAAIDAFGAALVHDEVKAFGDGLTIDQLIDQQKDVLRYVEQEQERIKQLLDQQARLQGDCSDPSTFARGGQSASEVHKNMKEAGCPILRKDGKEMSQADFVKLNDANGGNLQQSMAEVKQNMAGGSDDGAGSDASSDDSGSSGGGSTVIIIVVVLVVLFIVAGIVAVYVIQSNKDKDITGTMSRAERGRSRQQANYNNPAFGAGGASDEFTPGVANPLYDWYHPKMTRQECADHLDQKGDGAFVIRDSQATPGWHMLCVKTDGQVVHDKIRLTDNGKYELMPSMGDGAKQRQFDTIPELVEHYTVRQPGMAYQLTLGNPVTVDGVGNPMYGAGMGAYADVGAYGDATGAYGDASYGDATAASYGQVGQPGSYLDVKPDGTAA
jgi:hypothetical protein